MTQDDGALAAHQLRALAILEEATGAYGSTMFAVGGGGCLLATSCPGSMILGMLLDGPGASAFVQRMANIPIWVVILMTLLGLFFAVLGLALGLKMRNQGSPALAHLRTSPGDPFVAVSTEAHVRKGSRVLHVFLTARSGAQVHEVVLGTYEARVLQAIDAALPSTTQ